MTVLYNRNEAIAWMGEARWVLVINGYIKWSHDTYEDCWKLGHEIVGSITLRDTDGRKS